MRQETRIAFNGYLAQQAKINGVDSVAVKYTVAPTPAQKLDSAIQESNAFLKKINIIPVDEGDGEAILLGVNGPTASRTNTAGGARRKARNVSALTKDVYSCKKTNFDTSFPYQLLDSWAKFPDFQTRLSNSIAVQQGLDRIMIGFNGTSAAVDTDLAANPLLQDVNIGWLQKMRTNAPDRVIEEGVDGSGKVTIGATGDYKTLDALVFDAVQLLDPWHRKRKDLVVIVDPALLHEKQLKALENGADSNQEANAADDIITKTRLGGLPIEYDAPFFIEGGVWVGPLSNLSIYVQSGKRRRHIREEPDADQVADYQSSNEAYVIEDFGACALVENIEKV
ncbi:phage major capsid protein, P2 family [Pseudomonas nitroreducens]|uniref:phage major capsid protein, P2 family n=1 Tax=Pseudomonas nitroreducens TaxID=46680 RepID=UPI00265A88B5|nr:phage major capsid protein, P2 family [Pseudomonas nitroreducens]MCP1651789.1 P2 family phage major capsid protein [Pseudomonas nitroreducens]MCP1689583.1 P2 family phage major capsid protein [Pseudomonas nitroreducens]